MNREKWPPDRNKYTVLQNTSHEFPNLQLADFLRQKEKDETGRDENGKTRNVLANNYTRYFDIVVKHQSAAYQNLTKGRRTAELYKCLKTNKIEKEVKHLQKRNGDIYMVAETIRASQIMEEMTDIKFEKNKFDNGTEGYIFNPIWIDEEVDWIKEIIMDDHQEIKEEDIYVFKKKNSINASGRVKIKFPQHDRPVRFEVGLQTLIVEKPKVFVNQCDKCKRIGHRTDKCKDSRKRICFKCPEDHDAETECKFVRCVNCGGNHASDDSECKAEEEERKLRNTATDNGISVLHAKILHKTRKTEEKISYAGATNNVEVVTTNKKQEERLKNLEDCMVKVIENTNSQMEMTKKMMLKLDMKISEKRKFGDKITASQNKGLGRKKRITNENMEEDLTEHSQMTETMEIDSESITAKEITRNITQVNQREQTKDIRNKETTGKTDGKLIQNPHWPSHSRY